MRFSIIIILIMLCAITAGAAHAQWQGTTTTEDGVTHVKNPEQPVETVRIEFAELWERGGEDDDVLFGLPSQLVQDADGNLYILDSQLTEIQVYSPTGEYLRTIGREGEGPGEFAQVSDMYLGPNGLLGVVRVFPGRVYQIGTDGSPADSFRLPPEPDGAFQLVFVGRANKDHVVLAGAKQRMQEGSQMQVTHLKAYDVDGNEKVHYFDDAQETVFGGMKFDEKLFSDFSRRWALGDDGRIAVAMNFDDYTVDVYDADGTLLHVIERPDHKLLERSDAEYKRLQLFYDGITRWSPNSTFKVSKTHPAVGAVWYRPDGRLWVAASTGMWNMDGDVFMSVDEYDRDGRFTRQVDMMLDGDAVEDAVFFAGDIMYRVTDLFGAAMASLGGDTEDAMDEDVEPLRIIAYRMDSAALGAK